MPASVGAIPRGCGRWRTGWPRGLVWGSPCPRPAPPLRGESRRGVCPRPTLSPAPCPRRGCGCSLEAVQVLVPAPHPGPGSPPAGGAGPRTPSRLTSSEAHALHTPRERAWFLRGSLSPNRGLQRPPPQGWVPSSPASPAHPPPTHRGAPACPVCLAGVPGAEPGLNVSGQVSSTPRGQVGGLGEEGAQATAHLPAAPTRRTVLL